ncbi:MAG TPA: hypothetical protein VK120_09405 [Sporosarcina sp.]|nr:hypothetical protein [Sporosarcina sp.]
MWVVTVYEKESYKIFEFANQMEAKETFDRYSAKARLSFVA